MTDVSKNGINLAAACIVLMAVIKFTIPIAQMQVQVQKLEKAVERIETHQRSQPTIKEIATAMKAVMQDTKE